MKLSLPVIQNHGESKALPVQNKYSCKSFLVGQTVTLCTRKVVFKRSHGFIRKKEDRSEDVADGFSLFDSEAE